MVVKRTVTKVVSLENGLYSIELDRKDELKYEYDPSYMYYTSCMRTGRKLDKLNGGTQCSAGHWRSSSFDINLERAKILRELLDEYIVFKESKTEGGQRWPRDIMMSRNAGSG